MLKQTTTAFFLASAAAMALSLAAGTTSRAQHAMTHTPHPDMPDATRGKQGITHTSLLRNDVTGASGQEVIVWDTEYAPRAINPRHHHSFAITFHVVSGTGIWHEEGKAPVTLKAGDSLFTPAGTTHSHWNPSHTEKLRFLEYIVGDKNKTAPQPRPQSN